MAEDTRVVFEHLMIESLKNMTDSQFITFIAQTYKSSSDKTPLISYSAMRLDMIATILAASEAVK